MGKETNQKSSLNTKISLNKLWPRIHAMREERPPLVRPDFSFVFNQLSVLNSGFTFWRDIIASFQYSLLVTIPDIFAGTMGGACVKKRSGEKLQTECNKIAFFVLFQEYFWVKD